MTDPMRLLTAANPIPDCPPPDFDRLLACLEHEPAAPREEPIPATRGRFVVLRRTNLPRTGGGRRGLAVLVPVAVAVLVAAIAVVSLHPGSRGRNRSVQPPGSLVYAPGQARGRVVAGSMHRFAVAASGARGQLWGAEWFRTRTGQVCVQAGRQVGDRLGQVADGGGAHSGRFNPFPANTAVDARCIQQPIRGGIALTVIERVADGGRQLPPGGACTAAGHTPCPARDATTLYFGVVGSRAGIVAYGPEGHAEQALPAGRAGGDGEYISTFPGVGSQICSAHARCVNPADPDQLVHPDSRAFVIYTGTDHTCVLRGPGTDGVMSGRCPYGLTLGPPSGRLTPSEVRTHVTVATARKRDRIAVAARFRTRIPSARLKQYELKLSTPTRCPPSAGGTTSSLPLGPGFRAGQMLTLHGTVSAPCSGTYTGSVIVQPLVGSPITVNHFTFKER